MSEPTSAAFSVYRKNNRGEYQNDPRQFTRDLFYAYLEDIKNKDGYMFTYINFTCTFQHFKKHRTKLTAEHKKVLKALHQILIGKRYWFPTRKKISEDLKRYALSANPNTIPSLSKASSAPQALASQSAELKKLQTTNAELQRKIGRLQKEINQLKAELASPNDTSKSLE